MAKKNTSTPARPKEFQTVPFGSLKGLILPDAAPAKPEKQAAPKPAEQPYNGMDLFLQAVADVKPIHKKGGTAGTNKPASARQESAETIKPATPKEAEINRLFMEEIGRLKLDTNFADQVPDDGELVPLSGNRLRQVKRGVVSVEYQLDLHGLTREEALTALPRFLKSAIRKGQKAVLVITGKGNHSIEEPVIQQAVAAWLRDAGRELVLEFAPAPREMGGSGAFVVFLRTDAPKKGSG